MVGQEESLVTAVRGRYIWLCWKREEDRDWHSMKIIKEPINHSSCQRNFVNKRPIVLSWMLASPIRHTKT